MICAASSQFYSEIVHLDVNYRNARLLIIQYANLRELEVKYLLTL